MAKDCKDIAVLGPNAGVVDYMEAIINRKEEEESFYVLDLGVVMQQYKMWKEYLPNVKPYYAVKCNDNSLLLKTLATLGSGFDCASKEEIKNALSAGAKADDIIFANPCKPISHLKYAAYRGIALMTFDSASELMKINKYFPDARLVLRVKIEVGKESCLISLGDKFGCDAHSAGGLLRQALRLGLKVVGVSFHVGTGCEEPEAYSKGISIASAILLQAREMGFDMEYLDIGGGFPGDSPKIFQQMAAVIKQQLTEQQEFLHGIKVIAEPGRYMASKSFILATTIVSDRETDSTNIYYLNNGIYTSFNCVPTEKAKLQPYSFKKNDYSLKRCTIWGQTMEDYDRIVEECWLPEMKSGDWLYFPSMGAYSTCLSVQFCGFNVPQVYPVINEKEWLELERLEIKKMKNVQ